jgi:succinoglycan biosynthesis protein ExoW
MIGVVIPYYQKSTGLLNRALRSVAAQEGRHQLRVYVVDDASPIPAEGELIGLDETFKQNIVIFRQPNGGPGVARNLALDKMPNDIDFVAFLDSDDTWGEDHLNNARAAFAAGADFYFANHQREEDAQPRFAQCGYQPDGARIPDTQSPVYWCDGHALFRAVVLRSPVGTSTVAIRRSKVGGTRFPTWLRSAGEDSIFWLELLRGDMKAAGGTASEVAYGRGVSIFNHRSWGNAAAIRTTLDEVRLQIHLRQHFPLDREMIAQSEAQCRRLDLAFCANLVGCTRRLQWSAAGLIFAYIRHRPWVLLQLPPTAARVIWQKFRPTAP